MSLILKNHESLPRVAIVGRPNVGKSTLFNLLIGKRKSLVKDQPGVTRDILIETCELWGKWFEILDTGGLTERADAVSKLIKEHVIELLSTVDFLILVMDGKDGVTSDDEEVFRLVKSSGVPFLILVNKIDQIHEIEMRKSEFYKFGVDNLFGCSFENRLGISEFLEYLYKILPDSFKVSEEGLKIAFVGKPNVGKSSLINCLLGEKRVLVSSAPGTTVDYVEVPFIYKEKKYILIDTAGLRKTSKQKEDLEIIASFKTHEAIRKSDILFLVIDSSMGPTEQDAKILSEIINQHKMVIVIANKSDIAQNNVEQYRKKFQDLLGEVFHFYYDIPYVFTSASKGLGIYELLEKLCWAEEKINLKISTAELNNFFFNTIRKAPAPVWGTTNVKFYYITQTRQTPPAFIAFANHPEGVDSSYRRFLINQIKENFDLKGIPVRVFIMKSRSN